ncbi:Eco29kI family restriction endonuclease [Ramlibacter sp.]|uniref:Eco29kI family restriction endonuclease n=1 Tax=Ramlibacter sp. TaxID=1917967 RepID=UPI002CF672FC|nr:Eco29kI family restriction endonuclease [Ramlibacter sp.]HWI81515.1 Eco29kI family restriction endonuclease [Ramlibacter sp.]
MTRIARRVRTEEVVLSELKEQLGRLQQLLPKLAKPAANRAMAELLTIAGEIERFRVDLDPIKEPGASFDPSNPETAGRLVALALIAQERVRLDRIARTYGSGVYAIYYRGNHPAYTRLSRSETPIYVGKADPQQPDARTSREQGPQLYGRLADHRRMIKTVGEYAQRQGLGYPLRVEDFECRRLVCSTNAQLVAETHLIGIFKPIWNKEFGICWGISKHGDAATTRRNRRSPWDVMHPGREWAMHEDLEDKMSPEVIVQRIEDHLQANSPYHSRGRVVRDILVAFAQNAAMSPGEEVADDDAVAREVSEGQLPLE